MVPGMMEMRRFLPRILVCLVPTLIALVVVTSLWQQTRRALSNEQLALGEKTQALIEKDAEWRRAEENATRERRLRYGGEINQAWHEIVRVWQGRRARPVSEQ